MKSLFNRAVVAVVAGALFFVPVASQGAATRVRTIAGGAGFEFSPVRTSIVKGDSVKWIESSRTVHQIKFYKKPAAMSGFSLRPGDSVKRTFKKVGAYKYRCTIGAHSALTDDGICTGMCGVIKVARP